MIKLKVQSYCILTGKTKALYMEIIKTINMKIHCTLFTVTFQREQQSKVKLFCKEEFYDSWTSVCLVDPQKGKKGSEHGL